LRSDPPARQTSCELDGRIDSRFLHAQKLEVLGRLAGGIAHDFNNLLTVIKGYCGFVAEELPTESAARCDLDEVLKATDSAGELTRQILEFSRKSVAEPRRLDVKLTITRIAGMLRRVLGEDIDIETDFAPNECAVLADSGQLEQALMNLAVNGRDAMPDGGTLSLRAATVTIDASPSGSGVELAPGKYVSIVVEDTGAGIAPEVSGRIFEAFYTTKGAGTGLGLAMVLSIVKKIGGDIRVESAPGLGSRFTVLLPAVDTRDDLASRASTASAAVAPPPRGTETILLVEDEGSVRQSIRRMLERLGYSVREAATGAQALGIAATLAEPPDLVLTDVVMPGQSGAEVAKRLLQRWPSLKVLFMSGYTDDEIGRRGIRDSDARLLQKPITLELVGHAVRRALDGAKAA
jgi:two-component system cell cycle sensor histidine kinase/response regulator CckA